MNHDQLFKEIIQAFFEDFLRLFFPNEASLIDFREVTFLNQEVFTDIPDGDVRRTDTIAQVRTLTGESELILVHTEIQAYREADFPFRMWEYYYLLRARHRMKVLPIVLYLSPGAGGITVERYNEGTLNRTFLWFEYLVIGLPDLESRDYLERGSALAAALSALMKTPQSERVDTKYRAFVTVISSVLDEARKMILATVINRYMPLNDTEESAFEERIQRGKESEPAMAVLDINRVYEIIREDARYTGLQEGRQEGVIAGKRETVMRLLHRKFGELPMEVVVRVEMMESAEELDQLLDAILTANSLVEMGLTS